MSGTESFFTLCISLFLVLNAVGQVPVFLALLAKYEPKDQRRIIIREVTIALGILLLFIFFGSEILHLIGISASVIGIGGGLLLIIIALTLIFPKDASLEGMPQHEPFIVPLAIPGLAGPGTIAAVMLFATKIGSVKTALAMLVAWIPSAILILTSSYIKKYLGEKGVQAVERLGGMLIFLIGIQMFCVGAINIVKEYFV